MKKIRSNNFETSFEILKEDLNSKTVVDGKTILARVVGPSFFPDTTSRNGVHYSREAWEHALEDEDLQERLNKRLILGTIGHDPDITDNEVRSGIVSHIVSKLWIDDNGIGQAEFLVLNTEPGRILNTLLRAGSKISVSTVARGETESEDNDTVFVKPETFSLERIDFVINPGYKEALPELVESSKKNSKENKTIMENKNNMDDKLVTLLESQNKSLKEEHKVLTEKLHNVSLDNVRLQEQLNGFTNLGTVQELTENMNTLAKYESIGTVSGITKTLSESEEVIDALSDKVKELQDTLAQAKDEETDNTENEVQEEDNEEEDTPLSDLGSPDEIRQVIEQSEELKKQLAEYEELGTPDEIRDLVNLSKEYAKMEEENSIAELAKEFSVSEEAIKGLMEKGLSTDDIREVLVKLEPTVQGDDDVDTTDLHEESDKDEEKETTDKPDDSDEDDNDEDEEVTESLVKAKLESKLLKENKSSARLRELSRARGKKVLTENKQSKTDSIPGLLGHLLK